MRRITIAYIVAFVTIFSSHSFAVLLPYLYSLPFTLGMFLQAIK